MILKGFKEKSNKKYINKTLRKRVVVPSKDRIGNLGILVDGRESIDYDWFKTLADALKVNKDKIEIIAFVDKKKEEEKELVPTYEAKDIGWNGVIKNKELKRFSNTNFDLLINYYTKDDLLLKLLTVASKAKFKAGILQTDERLNDLIVKTELRDFKTFKNELVKYLNILNKI